MSRTYGHYQNDTNNMTQQDWAQYHKEYAESFQQMSNCDNPEHFLQNLTIEQLESLLPSYYNNAVEKRILELKNITCEFCGNELKCGLCGYQNKIK